MTQHALLVLFACKFININHLTILQQIINMPVESLFASQVPFNPALQIILCASYINIKTRWKIKNTNTAYPYTTTFKQPYQETIYTLIQDTVFLLIQIKRDITKK